MDVVDALIRYGGVAGHQALVAASSRWAVRRALEDQRIERVGRGVYALAGHDRAVAASRSLAGVVSHTSAAVHLGWPVWRPPRQPWVTVPRDRAVPQHRRRGVLLIRQDVAIDGNATTPVQTVLDCARRLPFAEALAVADSALRCRAVGATELVTAAEALPRPGRAREVARHADPRAANPFESVVRAAAITLDLPLVPQVPILGYGRADLADVSRRLIVECDSFGFHSQRDALLRDIERYNRAMLAGATVLRFGYEHAVDGSYVSRVLADWASLPPRRHTDPLPVV